MIIGLKDPTICCHYYLKWVSCRHSRSKGVQEDTIVTRIKGTSISGKADKSKENYQGQRHYIMIKRSVLQEDWANAYAPNSKASNI